MQIMTGQIVRTTCPVMTAFGIGIGKGLSSDALPGPATTREQTAGAGIPRADGVFGRSAREGVPPGQQGADGTPPPPTNRTRIPHPPRTNRARTSPRSAARAAGSLLRTKWTRRVPHPVLIGHATSAGSLHAERDDGQDEAGVDGRGPRGVGDRRPHQNREVGPPPLPVLRGHAASLPPY